MDRSARFPTPLTWAARSGAMIIPAFLGLGLALGILARAWMRLVTVDPEFTVGGTLGIVLGFGFFALMQSIAALAAQRPWRPWSRRAARLLGVVGLLPLFVAAGALMAPAVIAAGLAVWHPTWPALARWVLAVVAIADVVAVTSSIASDHGVSARTLAGVVGLMALYGVIVWLAAGTFARPTQVRAP